MEEKTTTQVKVARKYGIANSRGTLCVASFLRFSRQKCISRHMQRIRPPLKR